MTAAFGILTVEDRREFEFMMYKHSFGSYMIFVNDLAKHVRLLLAGGVSAIPTEVFGGSVARFRKSMRLSAF